MQTITYQGAEISVDFTPSANGLRLWVMYRDGEMDCAETVHDSLHVLATRFEALCSFASDHYGDTEHGETLAMLLDVPIVSSDDVECIKCGRFDFYDSEEMVLGCNALPEKAEALGLSNWDYACLECYLAAPGGEN